MHEEIFISYSHVDKPWAAKLAADLRGRGVTVFFDEKSLRAGEGWEGQLVEALKACKHLVCFWSAAAKESEWVQQELAVYRVSNPAGTSSGQKLVLIPLDGQRHTFTQIHNIESPALKAVYPGDPSAVSTSEWTALVDRVMTVRAAGASLQIPVAVLTLDARSAVFSPADLEEISQQLSLTQVELQGRYGKQRMDWKPFTGGDSISSYLNQSRNDINQWLAAPPRTVNESIDWEYPDDGRFWADLDYVREFAGKMEGGPPGLIVIDPVATLQRDVQTRLALFARCLRFENVAIVALHPSPATPKDTLFRDWVAKYTVALLDPYVAPRPMPDTSVSARLGIGVDDMKEMRRILKTSIGEVLRRRTAGAAPAAAAIRN